MWKQPARGVQLSVLAPRPRTRVGGIMIGPTPDERAGPAAANSSGIRHFQIPGSLGLRPTCMTLASELHPCGCCGQHRCFNQSLRKSSHTIRTGRKSVTHASETFWVEGFVTCLDVEAERSPTPCACATSKWHPYCPYSCDYSRNHPLLKRKPT